MKVPQEFMHLKSVSEERVREYEFSDDDPRGKNQKTYQDRLRLHCFCMADALWMRLLRAFKGLESPPDTAEIKTLERTWMAKAHPYAKFDVDPTAPLNDRNGQAIKDFRAADDPEKVRPVEALDFEGQWHEAFWVTKGEDPDYGAIADKIMEHLLVQEVQIMGEARRKAPELCLRDRGTARGPAGDRMARHNALRRQ